MLYKPLLYSQVTSYTHTDILFSLILSMLLDGRSVCETFLPLIIPALYWAPNAQEILVKFEHSQWNSQLLFHKSCQQYTYPPPPKRKKEKNCTLLITRSLVKNNAQNPQPSGFRLTLSRARAIAIRCFCPPDNDNIYIYIFKLKVLTKILGNRLYWYTMWQSEGNFSQLVKLR